MYRVELSTNAQRITESLERFPERMNAALMRALDYQNDLTVSAIQERRLSYKYTARVNGRAVVQPTQPDGLRNITGNLKRSMWWSRAINVGDHIESAIGSNISYARIHEFGYTGPVSVREHQRIGRSHTAASLHTVRAHTRQVNLPARRFIQRTIEERLPEYQRALSAAVESTWNQEAP